MVLLFISVNLNYFSYGQHDSLNTIKNSIDTSAVMDSLMKDFDMFKMSIDEPSSYFNINVNFGNRLFSKNNSVLNSQQASTSIINFTPTVAYYHKSGFSISGNAFMSLNDVADGFYQFAITPAYDLQTNKYISAGASYTRYINSFKDTLSAYATPYTNEFYGYFSLKKGFIKPGLSVGYSEGKHTDIYRGTVTRQNGVIVKVIDSQKIKVADFSLSFNIQHTFSWHKAIIHTDELSFTPVLMLNAGSGNTNVISHSNKLVNTILSRPGRKVFRNKPESTNFNVQSLALSWELYYSLKNFYIQPYVYTDYYLHDSPKKLTNIFTVTIGHNF